MAAWLCLFNIKRSRALRMDSLLMLISSPEWDKFDVCKLVSGLIKMVCYWQYCVVSILLYRSAVFSKSVS